MAIDHAAVLLAFRARAVATSVCTTGSTTLVATTTGYTRAAGSFATDGFAVGMEVVPTGFTQTTTGVIDAVTASALTINGGRTAESSGAGRTLAVGLPSRVGYQNVAFTPTAGFPYWEEDFVPATHERKGLATGGTVENTGLYVVRLYGLANRGADGLYSLADALLTQLPAGQGLSVSEGTLHVRNDVGPFRGAVRPDTAGWVVCTVTIPWRWLN